MTPAQYFAVEGAAAEPAPVPVPAVVALADAIAMV